MTSKNKALISACATSSIGMMWLVTSAVLAYMIGTYAAQGASPQQIVMVMTIQPLVGVFMAFLTGPISMRVSKKLLMCVACGLTIVDGIIYGILGGSCSYVLLYVGAALSGIVSGLVSTVPNSFVAQYTESFEERGKYSGYTNAFLQGGALVMSAVGGLLGASRWQNAFLLWFLAIPVLILVIILCPSDKVVKPVEKKAAVKLSAIPGSVWMMCLHFALFFICCYTFSVYISSYIITEFQLGTSFHAGIATALLTISAVLGSALYSWYCKKLGKWTMPFFCLTMAIGYAISATMTSSLIGILLAAFLVGLGKGGSIPHLIKTATAKAPRNYTPVIISFVMGSMSLGMFLSKSIIGAMCTPLGGESVYNRFVATAIMAVITLFVGLLVYGMREKEKSAEG